MKRIFLALLSYSLVFFAVSAQKTEYAVKVSSPNGAPGLALAVLAEKNPENYTYVAAEVISAEFANNVSDFIIAPVNTGARLYKTGKSSYKLAAVVTWGNLYFASQKKNFKIEDIEESGVFLFGENTINASVALASLEKNKINVGNVRYLGSAAATQSLLLSDKEAIVLTAEPTLTAAKIKNQNITSYSLNDLYKKATGFDGFAQAGLFVRSATLEKNPQAAADFLEKARESCAKCSDALSEVVSAAVKLRLLPNAMIAERAVPNCAVRYMSASDAREQIEAVANIDLAQFGGGIPSDDFYYGK